MLGFGDNIVDRFVDRGIEYPGGNSVNVAVYARRLGVESAYLGVFGDDELGAFLREAVAAEGVTVERCVVRAGESGVSRLRVDDGERVFLGWNGGGVTVREPLTLDDGLLGYVGGFDLVHSSVYSRSEPELPKLAGLGPLVSFDLSSEEEYRDPAYLDRVCPHADLVLLSCSHLDADATADLLADAVRRGPGSRSAPAASPAPSPSTGRPPCPPRPGSPRPSSTRWAAATPSSPGSPSRCCATAGPPAGPRRRTPSSGRCTRAPRRRTRSASSKAPSGTAGPARS
ncbi:Carbohydrate kinase, PfkB [[Actinomadura] parvosata subsp. kistnae]|nr:Carbohydrate kinase, PfkB [Actinomadura parvosata subsp. kistnae]